MNRWILMAVLAFGMSDAIAGFLVSSAQPKVVAESGDECEAARVRVVGTPPAARPLIANTTSESVARALRRVVPRNWVIQGDPLDENRLVSWRGGQVWAAIVGDIVDQAALCVTLDYTSETVSVRSLQPESRSGAVSEPSPLIAGTALVTTELLTEESLETTAPGEIVLDEAEVATAPIPAPPKLFELKGGDTLRSTLERWCVDEGWVLEWRADYDYPIDAGHTFVAETTLEEAVKAVLKTYWHRPKPLIGRAYKNHVLLISGR